MGRIIRLRVPGFLEHGTLKIVRFKPGDKILGTTTRTEYKGTNGVSKKREDFFKSLLSKRTDELLSSARALVARMKEELVTSPEGPVTGIPAGIDVNKPPKKFRDAMNTTPNTKVSSSTEH